MRRERAKKEVNAETYSTVGRSLSARRFPYGLGGQERFDIPTQGDTVKEAHGVDGDVDARGRLFALLDQVVQPVPDLLIRNQLWRTEIVARQITDVPGIGFLSAFSPTTNGQIPDVFGS